MTSPLTDEQRLLEIVLENPVCRRIVERAGELGVQDWFLTAGGVFQTVWNYLDGRDLRAGIKDYDLFYFDGSDLSYEAEDRVIKRAALLFDDINDIVEVRNEARVHLWYEEHFGVPAAPFTSSSDAIDHFASTTCCFGITRKAGGDPEVYAPHGFDDLFNMVLRPNPVMAPREVYDAKADRWREEWPRLTVIPWPER
ncbi:nucleotidyltransferase family protein [Rhodococcus artemisiae]|uniref:Nucleotidyltransferase family protein n=1 Tax=Rhodococcus artemisiae TaxID=714159 RepID=A0ABU7LJ65_9NOCA|nr:nucleotidyltransferase family protein [Rhodococcus artemisiae]MEE2061611.1 nucleotidyltransferase family protein [Rhodococcus artemisiae]